MKKSLLTLALMLVLATGSSQAATKKSSSYSGVIKANPLGLAIGYFNAEYELPLGPQNALAIDGSFFSRTWGYSKFTGFGAGGMYRFYSKGRGKQMNSFYYGPSLNVASFTWKYDDSAFFGAYGSSVSVSYIAFIPGAGLGRQWIFNGGFTLDVGGGINYYIVSVPEVKDSYGTVVSVPGFSGILPALWLSLGYAFGK